MPLQHAPRGTLAALALMSLAAAGPALAQTPAFSAQGGDVPVYGPSPEPVVVPGSRPLATNTLDALRDDGIYYFNGPRLTQLKLAGAPKGQTWPVAETSSDPATASVANNLDVAHFVLNGERRAVGKPSSVTVADRGGATLLYSGAEPLRVNLRLKAYDVSGLMMRDFLRTPTNYPKPEASKVGERRFPEGSVAYLAEVRFLEDVLMLPRRESFTGAKDTAQLVSNFSKDIPYCLSYDDRDGAKPYALHFRPASAGAKKGKLQVYPAKTGTLFCARAAEQVAGEGEWEEVNVGGTRAVVLSFAANVDPLDTGVTQVEREAAKVAFIEPTKGAPGVRPGKLYVQGNRVMDYQYRFNKAAADAISAALAAR
jgi:hypothetical protein